MKDIQNGELIVMVIRICTMTPKIPGLMEDFANRAQQAGSYIIVPIELGTNLESDTLNLNLGIELKALNVRPAWSIGDHDQDCVGIRLEDEPVIPDHITDPPVMALLTKRRQRANQQP